jgi:predicted ArsR family transcriptional regulator
MDLTDIPDDAYDGEESPPDLDALESPDSLLKGGSIRERLLDVVIGLRTPTKVSTIADRADCDTETARDYLEWFDEMGMVQRHDGRPVRYERNDAYFQWRRIDRIREEYSEQEIVDALGDTLEQIEDYRTQFDATHPDEVSLVNATQEQNLSTEAAWEALSEWETLEQRAALLDAARRNNPVSGSKPGPVDA